MTSNAVFAKHSFNTTELIPDTSRYLNGSNILSYRKAHIQESQNRNRVQYSLFGARQQELICT